MLSIKQKMNWKVFYLCGMKINLFLFLKDCGLSGRKAKEIKNFVNKIKRDKYKDVLLAWNEKDTK